MNFNLFSHVLAYSFLLSMLLLSLLHSRWHWWTKLIFVILVPAACVLGFHTWRQAQGWPSETAIPERFMLNGAIIEEPDPVEGVTGGVFLWLTDLAHHELGSEPRAYRLAYDKKLHVDIQQALRKLRDGKLQIGEVNRTGDTSESLNPNRPFGGQIEEIVRFRDLPDPALPEK